MDYTCCSTVSSWFLCCMTVQRAMSVVWPHRVNLLCTRRTVVLVLTGVAVFLAALYSHYLVGYITKMRPTYTGCGLDYSNDSYYVLF